jgi:hypothetical protein
VSEGKVVAGFFSFTEIHGDEHHSYNEWHMLDHMPEQFPLRGIVYGQRWVSTPACRAERIASEPRLDPIHYVTLYLMSEPLEETIREFYALGRHLHEVGRFHQHRTSHLSGAFGVTHSWAAARVLVSPEAVPYRPNRGIYVTVSSPGDVRPEIDVPGVAGTWTFTNEERSIAVAWLDDDPLSVARASGVALATTLAPSDASLDLAGPFETITPWKWDWFD